MKKRGLFAIMCGAALVFGFVLTGCENLLHPKDDDNGNSYDARWELYPYGTPGPVAHSATSAYAEFYSNYDKDSGLGLNEIGLSAADFAVSGSATLGAPWVSGRSVTIPVTFSENSGASAQTYTVSIAPGSTKIRGRSAATIKQAAYGELVDAASPIIIVQPQGRSYNPNMAATPLSVIATVPDGGTLSYQWYSNTTDSTGGGTAITGATAASWTPPTAAMGTLYYYVVVTNTNNAVTGVKTATATSRAARIIVDNLIHAASPIITVQPQGANYAFNAPATPLSVTAASPDGGTLSYQWYRDGSPIGDNSNTYTPPTATAGTFNYYVVVTNTNNAVNGVTSASTTSATAAIVVIVGAVPLTGVSFTTSNMNIQKDYAARLTAIFTPANATNQSLMWHSSDTAVATVSDGVVTAINLGRATITATAEDGGWTATCAVTVSLPALIESSWTFDHLNAPGTKWFQFTATAVTQFLHCATKDRVYIQLYDSNGVRVGSPTEFVEETWNYYGVYPQTTSRALTIGNVYQVSVTTSHFSGTSFQIAFSSSVVPPETTVTELTPTWADEEFSPVPMLSYGTSYPSQWFKFTASSPSQIIRIQFNGTLDGTGYNGVYVDVYNSTGYNVLSDFHTYGGIGHLTSSSPSISRKFTVGEVYHVKVTSMSSSGGTYQISVHDDLVTPNYGTAIPLTANAWASGSITGTGGEQWFKFTANSATQFIHADLSGSLSGINMQVYDSVGTLVVNTGSRESYTSSSRHYPITSRTLTVGNEYYIRVYADSTGTYGITFNNGIVPPGATPAPLAENTWASGNLVLYGQNWFKFTAASATQFIHADFSGTLSGGVDVRVYDSTGTELRGNRGTGALFNSNYPSNSWPLTTGVEYFVQVLSYSGRSGTYQIKVSTLSAP